jgi:hypothetical protein
MSDQVADVLDDAADLLERGGWIQEALYDSEGGFCSVGALYEVCEDPLVRNAAYGALFPLNGRRSVADWNNDPSRTMQEVLDAFRAAAKAERMRPETPASSRIPERDGAGTGLAGDAPTSG